MKPSPAELEVLLLLCDGHNALDIAAIRGRTASCVRSQIFHLKNELGVHTQIGLYQRAIECGLVDAPKRK